MNVQEMEQRLTTTVQQLNELKTELSTKSEAEKLQLKQWVEKVLERLEQDDNKEQLRQIVFELLEN